MEPYQHKPLNFGDEIRLLKLLPHDTDPIRIEIHHYALAKAPPFNALSYELGNLNADAAQIIVHDAHTPQKLWVNSNLHAFLQLMVQSSTLPYLWIDFICINGGDESDKVQAFRNMNAIYRTATRTLCWTGIEYCQSIQELIAGMSRRVENYEAAITECLSAKDIFHSPHKLMPNDLVALKAARDTIDERTWLHANAFFENRYFKRLWKIPHIVYSKNPVIFDGQNNISWTQLAKTILACTFLTPPQADFQSQGTMFVLQTESMRRKYHHPHGISIPDILLGMRACQWRVADLTNYVYAAYLIGGERYPEGKNFNAAYTQAFLDLNNLYDQPLSLSLVENLRPSSGWPSWCPNWWTHSNRFLLNHPASNLTASTRLDPRKYSCEPGTEMELAFTGFVVDTIRDISDYMPPRRHCDHYFASSGNLLFFDEWLEFAKERAHKRRTEEDVLLEYGDTIQARGCNHIWEMPFPSIKDRLREIKNFLDYLENPDAEESSSIQLFYAACFPSHDRRFGITRNKHFCLIPKNTRRDDFVCILNGSRVPYILRPYRDEKGYTWYENFGEAYVHGMMHGEASSIDDLEEMEFLLR